MIDYKSQDETHNANKDSSGGFFLVVIGSVLLLNTLGIMPWSVWRSIWKLWPALLIFAGLQMISGKSIVKDFISLFFGFMLVAIILTFILYQFVPDFQSMLSGSIIEPYLNFVDLSSR